MKTKTLILMQGIPGSGKSTIANFIAEVTLGKIFSTDELWYNEEGEYEWDASLLGEKHRQNQQLVAQAMKEGQSWIIVDNTNITANSVSPYIVLADIYNYQYQIIRVSTSIETCIERQLSRPTDRRVPEDVIRDMAKKMEIIDNDRVATGNRESELLSR